MENKPVVEVRNVSKKFANDMKWNMIHGMRDIATISMGMKLNRDRLRKNEFWALRNVSLDLYKGDILGILGKNGSGKTTLMRLIGNIFPFDTGSITTRGRVAAIFALVTGMRPHFTGRENIYIKGGMFGMDRKMIDEKMESIIEFSELGKFIDTPLGNYSSGMKGRLGYSIAIAAQPDVMIVDEGIAVGDAAFKVKCMENLRDMSQHCGVIFITHSVGRIKMLANRVMILKDGEIVHSTDDVNEGTDYYLDNIAQIQDKKYVNYDPK